MARAPRHAVGVVLGKFMPAHRGHLHLAAFAAGMCGRVVVLVDRVPGEFPAAEDRAALFREDLRGLGPAVEVRVARHPDPGMSFNPQDPSERLDFWDVWRDILVFSAAPFVPDALVASMEYGLPLARAVGAAFVPLDIAREAVPLAATDIRPDPWARWDDILPASRAPWLDRIALEGPESTGKSTVALDLARRFPDRVTAVPEYARTFLAQRDRAGIPFREEDLLEIAAGQLASERSIERQSRPSLVYDSSLLSTVCWAEHLFGRVDPDLLGMFLEEEARAPRRRLILTPDTPWMPDVHRKVDPDPEGGRRRFQAILLRRCLDHGLPHSVIPGGFDRKSYAFRRSVLAGTALGAAGLWSAGRAPDRRATLFGNAAVAPEIHRPGAWGP